MRQWVCGRVVRNVGYGDYRSMIRQDLLVILSKLTFCDASTRSRACTDVADIEMVDALYVAAGR